MESVVREVGLESGTQVTMLLLAGVAFKVKVRQMEGVSGMCEGKVIPGFLLSPHPCKGSCVWLFNHTVYIFLLRLL